MGKCHAVWIKLSSLSPAPNNQHSSTLSLDSLTCILCLATFLHFLQTLFPLILFQFLGLYDGFRQVFRLCVRLSCKLMLTLVMHLSFYVFSHMTLIAFKLVYWSTYHRCKLQGLIGVWRIKGEKLHWSQVGLEPGSLQIAWLFLQAR